MNDISERLCRSGWLITIAAVLTRAWDRAFPVRRAIASHHPRVAIRFRPAIASSLNPFSADFTTSIVLSPIAA
jgi:hypothetical protein